VDIKYEDLTIKDLGTRRQRPMYQSAFHQFRKDMGTSDYPVDPHAYTQTFLTKIDEWIRGHKRVKYIGLDTFDRRDAILGTTHQLDELHLIHGQRICVYKGEYKYHRRLTNYKVKEIKSYKEIQPGNVFVVSYPSCITTGYHDEMDELLDHCELHGVPVHIDGAWFGQVRNFEFDITHNAIKSVSVSLSKALGMGSQRIGIRYMKTEDLPDPPGPIQIMNDFNYANVSDMWIGVKMMEHFGVDIWWSNYEEYYTKVCKDFGLTESNSFHVAWDKEGHQAGIRTALRMLIDGIYDERGTDKGLNKVEIADAMRSDFSFSMLDFGKHLLNFDVKYFINQLEDYRSNPNRKVSGLKDNNYFVNIDPHDNKKLENFLNKRLDLEFNWNFEFFHSGEPVGLHTDYTIEPWDKETSCEVLVGVIIPLDWNTMKTPYTVNYNRTVDIPRKMMYKGGEMRYLDNNEVFSYRTLGDFDDEVLQFQPRDCEYINEYADLKIHSVCSWEIGAMILFDTKRWHSSSWFTESKTIVENSREYKEALVGFGSRDVPRN